MTRNIALQIAYDGTDFAGSQVQEHRRTVQSEIESAWVRLHGENVRVTLAGRTDAGVHATGQVGNVRTQSKHSQATLLRALNAILPDDVAVTQIWEPPRDFHARFWAECRTYEDLIDNQVVANPLARRYAWAVSRTLNVDAMHDAAQVLVGMHDFAAFTVGAPIGTTVRNCMAVACFRIQRHGSEQVAVRITANGFLRNMVRIVVGTLLLVGEGRLTADALRVILQGRNRQRAGQLAPAHGLTLVAVKYPRSANRPDPPIDGNDAIGKE